ncbi:MAG: hypothetical protein KIH69_003985 [Anaerolineae bacterium]|nr:hypothetical protein [Anaerolineae bacterium]
MKKIEGHYIASSDAREIVSIECTENAEWQVLWSASPNPLPMNSLSPEYYVAVEDDWEGLGYFDGETLTGYFPMEAFNEDGLIPEMLIGEDDLVLGADGLPAIGTFQAKLQADGSFAVTIERWDGTLPPNIGHIGWFEPAMTRIHTQWLRP